MNRVVVVCGVTVLCAGVGVGMWLATGENFTRTGPVESPPVVTIPRDLPAQAVLAEVVEVANLDALLDPPAEELVGVPFDADPPKTAPVSSPATAPRIPLAVD
ncbi:MAG TPA: hypothetical protein VLM40_03705 [Gemmata sp.]|nr:hypothetical protein [Gemmata sp.]